FHLFRAFESEIRRTRDSGADRHAYVETFVTLMNGDRRVAPTFLLFRFFHGQRSFRHLAAESQAPNWLDGQDTAGQLTDLSSLRQSCDVRTSLPNDGTNGGDLFRRRLLQNACTIPNHPSGMDRVLRVLDLGRAQSETSPTAGTATRAPAPRLLYGVRLRLALFERSA